ncbi:MAG: hypothetical protein AB7V26_05400 [Lysobacterales bacterium]
MTRTATTLILGLLLASAALTRAAEPASPADRADAAPTAAEAASDARFEADYQALQATLIEQMIGSANPRDWVMAPDSSSPERHTRLIRAAEAAPDDALVQWIAAHAVSGTAQSSGPFDPVAERIIGQLSALQPDNAAHLMPALIHARRQSDAVTVDRLLASMAARSRFDIHFADSLHAWAALASRSDTAATLDAMAALAALQEGETFDPAMSALVVGVANSAAVMPTFYQDLSLACHPADDLAAQTRRVDDCEKIARLMTSQSQTMIDRMIGDALLRKLERQSDADRALRRRWEWLMETFAEIQSEVGTGATFVEAWRNNNDELAVMTHTVQAAGIPLDPPADWISRSEARTQNL